MAVVVEGAGDTTPAPAVDAVDAAAIAEAARADAEREAAQNAEIAALRSEVTTLVGVIAQCEERLRTELTERLSGLETRLADLVATAVEAAEVSAAAADAAIDAATENEDAAPEDEAEPEAPAEESRAVRKRHFA